MGEPKPRTVYSPKRWVGFWWRTGVAYSRVGLAGSWKQPAAVRTALSNRSDADVIGILPGEEATLANEFVDIAIPSGMGYARNVLVVRTAAAVIAVGGGAGTLSEIAHAWQLDRPIVALDTDGFSGELAGRALDDRARPPIARALTARAAVELALEGLRAFG